ncbi:SRPBCC family protein [Streptosporangium sp. G11]|uniref:SRPBCC family protein n=1 Tax=Streptosporangium sp. G11 TaxID=3436926 RepID=UPI003EB8063E
MSEPEFAYTTYINTTPERLWQGLTDPAITRCCWRGLALDSDWKPGSTVTVRYPEHDVTIADPAQLVLESEPGKRLSYTWHTFTPQWAAVSGFSDELLARFSAERRSKVTFDLEDLGETVKLTVVHDDFEPGSAVLTAVTNGWPRLLADLKTLLETS